MNNTIIFWRHAKTLKDSSIPVSQWILTEDGVKNAQEVAETKVFDDVDIIITSTEPKAYETALPVATRLKKEIIRIPELSEINRDKGKMMSKDEYDFMKKKIFEDLDYTDHGWETCNSALNRFSTAVKKIDEQYENKRILIVAHGTVMSLFFASLQGKLDNLMSRWKGLGFCDFGIVKDNKVLKDVI
ncbi:histidine phosphatase family protein [Candidatus Woesearchaeota archaeon]|jgi:broad specificity phosphatase PhoE|nr:histidine phosphatase family protein [Candidatus Woesearchaeota archaeon]